MTQTGDAEATSNDDDNQNNKKKKKCVFPLRWRTGIVVAIADKKLCANWMTAEANGNHCAVALCCDVFLSFDKLFAH